MSKTIRNTLFTALLLTLTALGVNWNEEIARQATPVAIGQAVLAEFSGGEQSNGDLNLEIQLSRPTVLLGQYQVVSIQTVPFAELDLALLNSDGLFDAKLTRHATADELGAYRWRFQQNDFAAVGLVSVLVRARAGDQLAASRATFTLQTWSIGQQREEFRYPLLP